MDQRIDIQPARKVIVADDLPSARVLVAALLTHHGYRVYQAATAAELNDLLLASRFDAVILNLTMPPAKGPSYVSDVRALMSEDAKLVVYSAGDGQRVGAVVKQAGADHFFHSPINFSALLTLLEVGGSPKVDNEVRERT
ncbi:response regulator [Lysobacter terrae]